MVCVRNTIMIYQSQLACTALQNQLAAANGLEDMTARS